MPATTNECIALYEPPNRVSCTASGTVSGRRGVKVSASKATTGATVVVTQVGTLGLRPDGIAAWDLASTEVGLMIRWGVVPIDAGNTVTAGQQVMLDATGRVITWVFAASNANFVVGVAWADATVGNPCLVALSL
jgi:hypothetical protein